MIDRTRRTIVAGSAALLLSGGAQAAADKGETVRIATKDHEVRATYFKAPGDAKRPTALILHGAGRFERSRGG